MNFYDFNEIKQRGDCIQFLAHCGVQVDRHGRCAASWRGGDGPNVAVKPTEWFDHVEKTGGGLIELCMELKFPGDHQAAQNYLGEWLGLTPALRIGKNPTATRSRYDELIADGYREVKRYGYEDLDGNLIHLVARLEHDTKPKQFVQGTPSGWSLKGVTPILYRLKDWHDKSGVFVVEGEKDADTILDTLRLPATTNSGGADKWREEYNQFFAGKTVTILPDNDEAGEEHARRVARELKNVAQKIIIIRLSKLPKGDITDWIQQEGGTRDKLLGLLRTTEPVDVSTLIDIDPIIREAKEANRWEFSNYRETKEQIGAQTKVVKQPKQINAIIADIHRRFCGFPRRVGGSRYLFDHDHDTHEVTHIHDATELFAWIGRKSKQRVAWAIGDTMVTKGEIFAGLAAEATTYEAISLVPDWPKRDEVYYAHAPIPQPSHGYQFFNDLIDYFEPANDAYRTMLKAFIIAPLWYRKNIPRPGWIIDSEDGAGTGKTTLVELVSTLYHGSPIRTNKQELKTNVSEITKRLVSTEGRLRRILLVDNVTGAFKCAELSDFMTSASISGKAPYGRGEETRPNNLTYVITANSATVDNDLSDRCYFVHVKRPKRSGNWKTEVVHYIEHNRMTIIADIIGILQQQQDDIEPCTRFPEFECEVLRRVCDTEAEYIDAINILRESRASSNIEDDHAKELEEDFRHRLIDLGRTPSTERIFIHSTVAELWIREALGPDIGGVQYLRNLAKNQLTQRFDPHITRSPGEKDRRRGIMWTPESWDNGSVRIIGMKGKKICEII
jgi:5S rRNA maturation endonuclease (ribonuclease M5)